MHRVRVDVNDLDAEPGFFSHRRRTVLFWAPYQPRALGIGRQNTYHVAVLEAVSTVP